eukprot:Awhi_evm1s13240
MNSVRNEYQGNYDNETCVLKLPCSKKEDLEEPCNKRSLTYIDDEAVGYNHRRSPTSHVHGGYSYNVSHQYQPQYVRQNSDPLFNTNGDYSGNSYVVNPSSVFRPAHDDLAADSRYECNTTSNLDTNEPNFKHSHSTTGNVSTKSSDLNSALENKHRMKMNNNQMESIYNSSMSSLHMLAQMASVVSQSDDHNTNFDLGFKNAKEEYSPTSNDGGKQTSTTKIESFEKKIVPPTSPKAKVPKTKLPTKAKKINKSEDAVKSSTVATFSYNI